MIDVLFLGSEGKAPSLVLFGVTLHPDRLEALAFLARYDLTENTELSALHMEHPDSRRWVSMPHAVRVVVPALRRGYGGNEPPFLHRALTLTRLITPESLFQE
ncbi:hypothetical protein [Deinococcus peraridilitoris]|uniref:Uncharacterized protein n=1 Tax=Deinococcus peraridilitoris (strain DSM 19664 / LMG 22246 / CIP 109416 / KR-200) TaxID=937777 RepID=L0A0T4_DEIPD|nr:hypothetical protein [Deinococcus peraridilitoris]AFZ67069.1 hypothetical protein Deipe_1528 [Deinococcus peraridilitoris DSM 19664]